MRPITLRQAEVLGVIRRLSERGESPSLFQIGDALGVSHVAAWRTIQRLKRKGYVQTDHGVPRSIRVTDMPAPPKGVYSALSTAELAKVRNDVEAELVRRAVS